MRSKYLKTFLSLLSLCSFGYADQDVSQIEAPSIIQYHNRVILFAPLHQGYERIKPNAFYVGIEGYLAPIYNKSHDNLLLEAELRLGYNLLFNGKDHLTPFAGVGFIEDFFHEKHRSHHKPGIVYGGLGFLYNHEFNSIFGLGVNAQFLLGGPVNKRHFDWGSPVVGTDIALPITFRFGHRRHWDYRIEPFYLYLHGSEASQNYFGFRNSLGYRF